MTRREAEAAVAAAFPPRPLHLAAPHTEAAPDGPPRWSARRSLTFILAASLALWALLVALALTL